MLNYDIKQNKIYGGNAVDTPDADYYVSPDFGVITTLATIDFYKVYASQFDPKLEVINNYGIIVSKPITPELARELAADIVDKEVEMHKSKAVIPLREGKTITLDYTDETYDYVKRAREDLVRKNLPNLETSDDILNFLTLTSDDLNYIQDVILTQRNIWHAETIGYLKQIKEGVVCIEINFSNPIQILAEPDVVPQPEELNQTTIS